VKKIKSKILASIASITLGLGVIASTGIEADSYHGKVTLVGDIGSKKSELIEVLSERDPELRRSLRDAASQEAYLSLLPTYLRGSNVVIITVDLGAPDDISVSINRWVARVNENLPENHNAEIIVVGTNPNNVYDDLTLLENAVNSSVVPNAEFIVTDATNSYGIEQLQTFIVPRISQDQHHADQSHRLTLFERIRALGNRIRYSLQNL